MKATPITEYVNNYRQNWLRHVKRMDKASSPNDVPIGRRLQGRSRRKWLETVEYHLFYVLTYFYVQTCVNVADVRPQHIHFCSELRLVCKCTSIHEAYNICKIFSINAVISNSSHERIKLGFDAFIVYRRQLQMFMLVWIDQRLLTKHLLRLHSWRINKINPPWPHTKPCSHFVLSNIML
jgi:hypothetical protein